MLRIPPTEGSHCLISYAWKGKASWITPEGNSFIPFVSVISLFWSLTTSHDHSLMNQELCLQTQLPLHFKSPGQGQNDCQHCTNPPWLWDLATWVVLESFKIIFVLLCLKSDSRTLEEKKKNCLSSTHHYSDRNVSQSVEILYRYTWCPEE